jgi:hypothetical protein
MKYNNLVPNARFTKEWEGYIKSWTFRKKQSKKKHQSRIPPVPTPTKSNPDPQPLFSVQEIKVAGQKSNMAFVSYLSTDKLH